MCFPRLTLRRAPTLNRYVISLCGDGATAHSLLQRLAVALLRLTASPPFMLQPCLLALEDRAAARQAELQAEAAQQGATAASIVAAVIAESTIIAGSSGQGQGGGAPINPLNAQGDPTPSSS